MSSATCRVCSKLYVDPRVLPCLHTFCYKCLEKRSGSQASVTQLECPTCKKVAELPEGGVTALQKNVRKTHEAESVRITSMMQSNEIKPCGLCVEKNTGPAVAFCRDCGDFLCKPCSTYHKVCRKFLNHEVILIRSAKSRRMKVMNIEQKPTNCHIHEDEILKFYCETCMSLICRDCMAIEHTGHSCNRLEKVVEKEKAELQAILRDTDLESIKAKLNDAIAKVEDASQKFQKGQVSAEEKIESKFTALSDSLLKRKQVLLRKHNSIQTEMTNQTERFSALQMELVHVYDLMLTATQVYGPDEMLSVKGIISTKMGQLLKQYEEVTGEPCVNDMTSCNLDSSSLISKVTSLGEVAVSSSPEKAENDFYFCTASQGKEKEITITTYDLHGERFPCGGELVKVALSSSYGPLSTHCNVVDNKDGTYIASFTPDNCGEYNLSITFYGRHIRGSPFNVHVRYQRDCSYHLCAWATLAVRAFQPPIALAANGDEVYVSSANNNVINVCSRSSSRSITLTSCSSPTAIAIHEDALFVCDSTTHQVHKFSLSGKLILSIGKYGSGDGQLNSPSGICVHKDGLVFVSDCSNNRISVFKPNGTFLYHIKGNVADGSSINSPRALSIDNNGKLHVVCTNHHQTTCQVYTPRGDYITRYNTGGTVGIAIDDEGTTYAVSGNGTLCILKCQHANFNFDHNNIIVNGITSDKKGNIYVYCYNNLTYNGPSIMTIS